MSRRRAMFGGLIAAALLVSACTTEVEPIQVSASCPTSSLRGPDQFASEPGDRLIDDFEDGDLDVAKVSGRTGNWTLGTDGSAGSLIVTASSLCSARGQRAGHFYGAGFNDWGANWTAVFVGTSGANAAPFDARGYGGISFWAAAGGDATAALDVPIGLTTMDVAWNSGMCTKCMDFYRSTVTLTHAWQRFTRRFDELTQVGWGLPQAAMKHDQMVGFIVWPSPPFDIWIDDIRFEP